MMERDEVYDAVVDWMCEFCPVLLNSDSFVEGFTYFGFKMARKAAAEERRKQTHERFMRLIREPSES